MNDNKSDHNNQYTVTICSPNDLSKPEKSSCIALVRSGGALINSDAAAGVLRASVFAVARERGRIVAVGAIKPIRRKYASEVAKKSTYAFDPTTPELGYVAVDTQHRNRGLSCRVVEALLENHTGNIFATTDDKFMMKTLQRAAFVRRGKKWKGNRGILSLWIRKPDEWEEFRNEDTDPIGIDELKRLNLATMPEDVIVRVMDNYFPETTIWREGDNLICEIQEHLYTKYWEHKFSAYAFAEAMERAVLRLGNEGHPFTAPSRDDEDVHIFVRWQLRLPRGINPAVVTQSIKSAFDLVWQRADSILENSDSVLILGKDSGAALDRLKLIAAKLEQLGYYTYIIKEQPNRFGESIIQKVMRYALSSKFVIIENTEPSGHLYEIPHVAKAAECITVVLQEEGKGATWMFEDAYAKHTYWHKITYQAGKLEDAVQSAATWAENFVQDFAAHQLATLPWLKC